ncbi:MAG: alkaline phosphatase D family protein [Deltaproteobacteria bacterium]|nr:alkaline phosphatase D family protein [Deltaproteobacteria bacterium]
MEPRAYPFSIAIPSTVLRVAPIFCVLAACGGGSSVDAPGADVGQADAAIVAPGADANAGGDASLDASANSGADASAHDGAPTDANASDDTDGGVGDDANATNDAGENSDAENSTGGDADTVTDGGTNPSDLVFQHGVASGDPLSDRVILWTRVTPRTTDPEDISVDWRIARNAELTDIVASGMTATSTDADYTVKIDAAGLEPGTTYWYQFSALQQDSAIGRTKTLPRGSVDQLRIAAVSCSHFAAGYFNVYGRIAARNTGDDDLDVVLHLGDYFYEYGPGEYGDGSLQDRAPRPAHEAITLDDYRQRHAQYKTDPDLQAMHATHPMIAVWDDHEAANNAWTDGAENNDTSESEWQARKQAAIQAYNEWMPIRTPSMNHGEIFRQFEFGNLLTLTMLDTRHFGRNRQLSYEELDPNDPMPFIAQLTDEDRTMLGSEQEAWLEQALRGPRPAVWDVIGQQVMVAPFYVPEVPPLPIQDPRIDMLAQLRQLGLALAEQGALPGLGLYFGAPELDAWDGYIAARERLLNLFNGIDNVVVLSGDFHSAWASELVHESDLRPDGYDPSAVVGVEFLTTSVSAPGFDSEFGALTEALESPIRQANPHVKYNDLRHRGFVVLTFTEHEMRSSFFSVDVRTQNTDETLERTYRVEAGRKALLETP